MSDIVEITITDQTPITVNVAVQGTQGPQGEAGLSGGGTWGSITGTLSSQTDLQAALDAKQASDADLTALANLSGTGYARRTSTNTWTLDTPSAGIGGSTGATDNRILRADGTGGATVQNSAVTIDDSGNVTGVISVSVGSPAAGAAPVLSQSSNALRVTFDGAQTTQGLQVVTTGGTTLWTVGGTLNSGNSQVQLDAQTAGSGQGRLNLGGGYLHVEGGPSSTGVRSFGNLNLSPAALGGSGVVQVNGNLTASGLIGLGTYTVGTLPVASANAGRIAQVTDSSVTTNGFAVLGGGGNRVMVFSNGTTWDVVVA